MQDLKNPTIELGDGESVLGSLLQSSLQLALFFENIDFEDLKGRLERKVAGLR